MPYIDQLRMPRNSYTGHKIPKIFQPKKLLSKKERTETQWWGTVRLKVPKKLLSKEKKTETQKGGKELRWMPYIDQLRMPRNSYTGHKILEIPIDIGQLCVSYVINSSLGWKEYANLQKIRFLHTAKGSLSKVMKHFMRPLYTQRWKGSTRSMSKA